MNYFAELCLVCPVSYCKFDQIQMKMLKKKKYTNLVYEERCTFTSKDVTSFHIWCLNILKIIKTYTIIKQDINKQVK